MNDVNKTIESAPRLYREALEKEARELSGPLYRTGHLLNELGHKNMTGYVNAVGPEPFRIKVTFEIVANEVPAKKTAKKKAGGK